MSHHLISKLKKNKWPFGVNGALPSKRTLEFAGLSQVVHVLTSQYGFTCYKDEECSLLLPLNRQKQQPVNREGWVSEVVHMLITTSSIWEFQLVHQTWNTKIINSLSFNFFILPSLLLLIMVSKVIFYMTTRKQKLVFSVRTAGSSRLGMQESRDELPRPISCIPEG